MAQQVHPHSDWGTCGSRDKQVRVASHFVRDASQNLHTVALSAVVLHSGQSGQPLQLP
jgi:hypothetical protein